MAADASATTAVVGRRSNPAWPVIARPEITRRAGCVLGPSKKVGQSPPMNVLLIGSGGREHALAWKLAQSPLASRGSTPRRATPASRSTPSSIALDIADHAAVVGLLPARGGRPGRGRAGGAAGRRDRRRPRRRGHRRVRAVAGGGTARRRPRATPRTSAPRPASRPRATPASAMPPPPRAFVRDHGAPIVVKADGLAAGKGVTVAATVEEAVAAVGACFSGAFGAAGAEVVVEECLTGEEASFFALCDGKTVRAARDRAGPQARVRRRPRAQHRRHGRVFAGAGDDGGPDRADDGHDRHADGQGDGAARDAVRRRALRRADAHRPRAAAHRIQRALRRPRDAGADAAARQRPSRADAGDRRGAARRASLRAGARTRR